MLKLCRPSHASKIWKRFTLKKADGEIVNLCFVDLPKDRVDDLVDFNMNYFVRNELTHIISGVTGSEEAMSEYKEILRSKITDPSIYCVVCLRESNSNDKPEIIGSDTIKLVKRGDAVDVDPVKHFKTKELERYFKITRDWNNLYPMPYIMKRFDLPYFFDDIGLAIHPDYRRYGVANQYGYIRRMVCQAYDVPMAGAWLTAMGTIKATKHAGWEVLYEICRERLEDVVKVSLKDSIPIFKYAVIRK